MVDKTVTRPSNHLTSTGPGVEFMSRLKMQDWKMTDWQCVFDFERPR